MKLVSFRVRLFRNIVDSGDIPVDPVTALVGKNESGKSAVLQALHHLNPAKPAAELNLLDEYPRWLKKEHEIAGTIGETVPISAIFEMTDAEFEELESHYGAGVVQSRSVVASRKYSSPSLLTIDVEVNYKQFVTQQTASYSERLKKAVGEPETSTQLIDALKKLSSPGPDASASATSIAGDATEALETLTSLIGQSLQGTVSNYLRERLPRTFYFSSYSQLRGRYSMPEVFKALSNQEDDEEIVAAADFLRLARAVPATLDDWDFEASNAELESVSSLLSRRVREHWKQNDHLRLSVRIEDQKVIQSNGYPDVERYLQFRVEDSRHDFSSRLDRRSTGFQWFISFLASFLEFEQDTNLILLLDEPGLSLHARAQLDLLVTIEQKLAINRTVIYSTHSPFMIQPNKLKDVRIVEDRGPERGTEVLQDAGAITDPDTLFPLQAALGYDVAQTLFVGNQNVVVEGVSDFIYLSSVSSHLESLGRTSLTPETRILPAGSASNIPTFIALLGTSLDVVVVVDGGTDTQRIDNAIARGRLDAAKVLTLSNVSQVPKPDIEDLFTPSEYVALYNKAFSRKLKLSDLTGKDRIVDRISRKIGASFDHGVVAASFLRNLPDSLKSMSPETLDRFEELIKAINAALPKP